MTGRNLELETIIKSNLKTDCIGKNLYCYNAVDSTNLTVKQLAEKGEESGAVVVSEIQLKGRGRLGRQWQSLATESLYFSVLVRSDISAEKASGITLLAGLCVCKALRKLCGIDAKIKWPNDIIVGNKKICGILTELSANGVNMNYAVIGIGINISNRSFAKDIANKAGSIYLASGIEYSKQAVLCAVLNELDLYYDALCRGMNDAIVNEYKKLCATLGREVTVQRYSEGDIKGAAKSITDSGELVITANGKEIIVNSGEVTVQGIY